MAPVIAYIYDSATPTPLALPSFLFYSFGDFQVCRRPIAPIDEQPYLLAFRPSKPPDSNTGPFGILIYHPYVS